MTGGADGLADVFAGLARGYAPTGRNLRAQCGRSPAVGQRGTEVRVALEPFLGRGHVEIFGNRSAVGVGDRRPVPRADVPVLLHAQRRQQRLAAAVTVLADDAQHRADPVVLQLARPDLCALLHFLGQVAVADEPVVLTRHARSTPHAAKGIHAALASAISTASPSDSR